MQPQQLCSFHWLSMFVGISCAISSRMESNKVLELSDGQADVSDLVVNTYKPITFFM
jgi:hypothetical protein